MNATPYLHVDIEPAASDFLELLRELGHLDDAAIERLTADLMRQARPGQPVTLDIARRAIAQSLFDGMDSMRPESRDLLVLEWGRLFG